MTPDYKFRRVWCSRTKYYPGPKVLTGHQILQHRQGKVHSKADALSRIPHLQCGRQKPAITQVDETTTASPGGKEEIEISHLYTSSRRKPQQHKAVQPSLGPVTAYQQVIVLLSFYPELEITAFRQTGCLQNEILGDPHAGPLIEHLPFHI